jgi:hypothetical protein
MWKNATRSVGQLAWLTGLGPPVVFEHAGGPPHEFVINTRGTSLDDVKAVTRTEVWGGQIEVAGRLGLCRFACARSVQRGSAARAKECGAKPNFSDYTPRRIRAARARVYRMPHHEVW